MNQNLSSYKIFYTVAKAGNISKAARELYISQPAISKSIQKLEESLGTSLFLRSSRGVQLTDKGQILFEHVDSAFQMLDQGESRLRRSIELGTGHISFGVSNTLCKHMLLPYLKEYIKHHPHISISISCQATKETISLLENGKIDIGLVAKPEKLNDLEYYPISEIKDIFVANKSYLHHLHERGIGKNDILRNANLMLLDKNNMTRQYIDDFLEENQIKIHDSIDVSSMDLLIEFATIGLGVACVIKNFVLDELKSGELIEIPLGFPIHTREIGFVYRKGMDLSSALKSFVEFYHNYLPETSAIR